MTFQQAVDFVLGKQKMNMIFMLVLLLRFMGVVVPADGVDPHMLDQGIGLAITLWNIYNQFRSKAQ